MGEQCVVCGKTKCALFEVGKTVKFFVCGKCRDEIKLTDMVFYEIDQFVKEGEGD